MREFEPYGYLCRIALHQRENVARHEEQDVPPEQPLQLPRDAGAGLDVGQAGLTEQRPVAGAALEVYRMQLQRGQLPVIPIILTFAIPPKDKSSCLRPRQ